MTFLFANILQTIINGFHKHLSVMPITAVRKCLPKPKVAGSCPVYRSNLKSAGGQCFVRLWLGRWTGFFGDLIPIKVPQSSTNIHIFIANLLQILHSASLNTRKLT